MDGISLQIFQQDNHILNLVKGNNVKSRRVYSYTSDSWLGAGVYEKMKLNFQMLFQNLEVATERT
jgi:hypothetical protein